MKYTVFPVRGSVAGTSFKTRSKNGHTTNRCVNIPTKKSKGSLPTRQSRDTTHHTHTHTHTHKNTRTRACALHAFSTSGRAVRLCAVHFGCIQRRCTLLTGPKGHLHMGERPILDLNTHVLVFNTNGYSEHTNTQQAREQMAGVVGGATKVCTLSWCQS